MVTTITSAAPVVLRLLAHDLRWRLVGYLAQSDRRVGELVELVGERQNLVSYHLRLLKQGSVVSERRSSHDARDIYYSLDLERVGSELRRSTRELHPSLGISVPQSATGRPSASVLFLCTGNSARSQMAEALLRKATAGSVAVSSAGTRPAGVHPMAIKVLAALGVNTEDLHSKGLDEIGDGAFDLVVTLCDIAREQCPDLPQYRELIHWSLADPAAVDGPPADTRLAFERTADELASRIAFLLPRL